MTRGGERDGAGRPFGTKKEKTVAYHRRGKPEWVAVLNTTLSALKSEKNKPLKEIKKILENYANSYIGEKQVDGSCKFTYGKTQFGEDLF